MNLEREEIFQYVKEQYGTEPEYLWKKDPDSAVLRHKNGKWYAIIMAVEKKTLGLEEDGKINILDVKCDPDLAIELREQYSYVMPGYHANKKYWNTIVYDKAKEEQMKEWMLHSYTEVVKKLPKIKREELFEQLKKTGNLDDRL